MRIIFALIFAFLLSNCSSKSTTKMEEPIISYEALSRGFYMKAEIKGSEMNLSKDRSSKLEKVSLRESDVKELQKAFEKIDLNEIENYKGPTEKRFYDGAAIANLTISYQGKMYNSQSFDHGNPPLELADFINKIVSLTASTK